MKPGYSVFLGICALCDHLTNVLVCGSIRGMGSKRSENGVISGGPACSDRQKSNKHFSSGSCVYIKHPQSGCPWGTVLKSHLFISKREVSLAFWLVIIASTRNVSLGFLSAPF